MTLPRIVLSVSLLLLLCIAVGFNLGARADSAPPTDNGIGTSPSHGADDVQDNAQPYTPEPMLVCGIWVDDTPAAADARSLAGEPPDVVVFPSARTGCYDAVGIASVRWPEHSFVRAVVFAGWRAREAPTPHALLLQLRRLAPLQPARAAFPFLAVLAILVPVIQTVIGKVFAAQVKDANRRTEIAGYVDTAFHLVEQLGPQLGLTGHEKYLRFIEQIVDSLKAAGSPDLSAKEMAELQQKAAVKSMLAKARAVLPPARPLPLPPPPRG